jgi:hypothetical protein
MQPLSFFSSSGMKKTVQKTKNTAETKKEGLLKILKYDNFRG